MDSRAYSLYRRKKSGVTEKERSERLIRNLGCRIQSPPHDRISRGAYDQVCNSSWRASLCGGSRWSRAVQNPVLRVSRRLWCDAGPGSVCAAADVSREHRKGARIRNHEGSRGGDDRERASHRRRISHRESDRYTANLEGRNVRRRARGALHGWRELERMVARSGQYSLPENRVECGPGAAAEIEMGFRISRNLCLEWPADRCRRTDIRDQRKPEHLFARRQDRLSVLVVRDRSPRAERCLHR